MNYYHYEIAIVNPKGAYRPLPFMIMKLAYKWMVRGMCRYNGELKMSILAEGSKNNMDGFTDKIREIMPDAEVRIKLCEPIKKSSFKEFDILQTDFP